MKFDIPPVVANNTTYVEFKGFINQLSEKVSGGFYLNNDATATFTLTRGSDGKWTYPHSN